MTQEALQQLIARFWAGKTSRQERHVLQQHLDSHRKLRDELSQRFGSRDLDTEQPFIGRLQSGEWLQKIHDRAGINQHRAPVRRMRPALWLPVAAALLLVCCTALLMYIHSVSVATATNRRAEVPHAVIHHNAGAESRRIDLPDHSVVYLSPHSELSYPANYNQTTRSVTLSGKGRFQVTPDKKRPFIVYANGFSTTALGTEFIVNTKHAGKMIVRLLSGKVVVAATGAAPFKMAATYLQPGDELQVNILEETLAMTHTAPLPQAAHVKAVAAKQTPTDNLQFSRVPLAEVFRQLAAAKGIRIDTASATLNGLSFSGTFLQTDPADTMLKIICTMNDLTYRHEDDQIIVTNNR